MLYALLFVVVSAVLAGVWLWRHPRPTPSPVEPRIVEAVFTMASHRRVETAHEIERAMQAAVLQHMAEGRDLNDSATLRRAMLAARDCVVNR